MHIQVPYVLSGIHFIHVFAFVHVGNSFDHNLSHIISFCIAHKLGLMLTDIMIIINTLSRFD